MTRICITSTGPTLESPIDPRFGRCAYFIIADPQTYEFEAVSNEAALASGGAGIRAAQTVVSKNVETVLTGSVGPNAFPALKDASIKILTNISGTVKTAIDRYRNDNLDELKAPGPSNVGKGQGGPGRGLGMGYGGGTGMGFGRGSGGGRGHRRRGGRSL